MKRIILTCILAVSVFLTGCSGENTKHDNGAVSSMDSSGSTGSTGTQTQSTTQSDSAASSAATVKTTQKTTVAGTTLNDSEKAKRLASILKSLSTANQDCPAYDLGKYVQPYWEGNVVYNESVMVLKNEDGTVNPISLMYDADKILAVRDAKLSTLYKENVDYKLENGKLVILNDSSIPQMNYGAYYLTKKIVNITQPRTGGGYIAFGEGNTFHKKQIAVTYVHTSAWSGPVPKYKGSLLPKTVQKLKNKQPVKILFYGDSITTGANSSGIIKTEPYAESWCDMMVNGLKEKYGNPQITSVNTAVGGTTSGWGVQNAQSQAADQNPDLAVIAFGMNDGTFKVAANDFKDNINAIVKMIQKTNPNCEFLIVSSMLPNPEAADQNGLQYTYPPVLQELETTSIAMVNVTELHKALLSRKRYFDMTGNNVNHPNDFLARLYAQAMIATLYR